MKVNDGTSKGSWRSVLDVVTAAAMIAASSVFIWAVFSMRAAEPERPVRRRPPASSGTARLPQDPIPLDDGSPLKGGPRATVGVIEFSDFECPYCATFARNTLPQIIKSYVDTGKILFAFRHLPLESRHPSAFRAAEAAVCGQRQGRFWEIHDGLFDKGRTLDTATLFAVARLAGLDSGRFQQCMTGEGVGRVRQDLVEARALGVTATPTFFFGSIEPDGRLRIVRRESGALSFQRFAPILDELLDSTMRGTR